MSAVSRLDKAAATRRAQRVRDGVSAIAEVVDTLVEIQERQDWLALGYKTWAEYCEGEFGPTRLKLTAEQRAQVVAVLVASGMPKRRVATALGVSEGTVRNDTKRSKGAQNYALPGAAPQVDGEESDGNTTHDSVASSTEDATDGEHPTALGESPAAGPGAQTHVGEADRPGPAVTPTEDTQADGLVASDLFVERQPGEDHRAETPGETDDAGTSSGPSAAATGVSQADGTTSTEEPRPPSLPQAAEEVEEQAPAGVSAPAPPHTGDPAALLHWFADRFEEVDPDVSGPLMTADDMALLGEALGRIAFVVDRLTDWHERARS